MDSASQRSIAFAVRVANKLRTLGWTVTPMQDPFCSGIVAECGRERLIARCRFQVSAVELEAVHDVLATAPRYQPCRMLVVAQSNYYTNDARMVARDSGVILVTLRELDARGTWDRRGAAQSAQAKQSTSGPTDAASETRAEQAARQRAEAEQETHAERAFREQMARVAAKLRENKSLGPETLWTWRRISIGIAIWWVSLLPFVLLLGILRGPRHRVSPNITGTTSAIVPPLPLSDKVNIAAGPPAPNDTATLTVSQRAAIGSYVRRCWTDGSGVPGASRMQVMLEVTTDADGMARIAQFAPSDEARMDGDPAFRRFAERARRAVFDPRCVKLPLPNDMLGKVNVLDFCFSP